ncbi:SDR family oxidoreductase [Sneathiella sp. CAU 1612]|jgi:citronellol/citronellal dehydrogenase|uniref:Peroxisomal trans-2-enoyl-CoA reductase n=1 Tax=Sneathiella sedimenti TaxID=2816034 RepID=A0ABS3F1C2_9PROT|nr:SDR family oxidoreductase [Sneathiella sedimenti]MBO0332299.1 SDR family oxidoreductase [Sneathiella sedimenti]
MSYRSIYRPGLFDGQSIVITGGGSGIGRCTAHELVSLGARVALVGRSMEKLKSVQAELSEAGGEATVHTCDIRDEEAVKATVAEIIKEQGAIHGLVNNAGGQFPARLEEITLKGWDAVIKTNLTGGFLFARECYVQWMKENGGGPIVNMVADMWNSMPGMGHSGAARKGMISFTETAALEWAAAGVRVNAIAPGMIVSSGMDTYPDWWKERVTNRIASHPVKRMGTESEVSAGIVYLLSEAATFITGSCLRIDGGAPNIRMNWDMPDHKNNKAFNGFHLTEVPAFLREDEE